MDGWMEKNTVYIYDRKDIPHKPLTRIFSFFFFLYYCICMHNGGRGSESGEKGERRKAML